MATAAAFALTAKPAFSAQVRVEAVPAGVSLLNQIWSYVPDESGKAVDGDPIYQTLDASAIPTLCAASSQVSDPFQLGTWANPVNGQRSPLWVIRFNYSAAQYVNPGLFNQDGEIYFQGFGIVSGAPGCALFPFGLKPWSAGTHTFHFGLTATDRATGALVSLGTITFQVTIGSTSCPAYRVIDSRGSGATVGGISPPGFTFYQEFQRLHSSSLVRVTTNPYAAVGFGTFIGAVLKLPLGYNRSVVQGKNWLSSEIASVTRSCPQTNILLTGYSQGAQVTGDVYQNGGSSQVLAAALFGDPYFNSRDVAADRGSFRVGLNGVLGTRPIFSSNTRGRVLSYCHEHDPVCQGPLSFFELALYRFSRHTNYDKLGEPQRAAQYFTSQFG